MIANDCALFLDGIYDYRGDQSPRFQRVRAPNKGELEYLVQLISQRVGHCLERQGLLEQDTESITGSFRIDETIPCETLNSMGNGEPIVKTSWPSRGFVLEMDAAW